MSKKMILGANGTEATVTEAKLIDVVATMFNGNEKLTGTLGLVQDVALIGIGMVAEAKLGRDTFKPKLFGG